IPFFVALPVFDNFDSMANWRIILIVLFLVLFFKKEISLSLIKNTSGRFRLKENLRYYPMEYYALAFVCIGFLSLLVAQDFVVGLKKLIFLINMVLLFVIIRNLAKDETRILKIIKAAGVASISMIFIGFLQLCSVLFVSLYTFWQFWAKKVILIFYGKDLSQLLSEKNAWFSYYANNPPTLRLFSLFPDSHSFAMFCILSIPFFLCLTEYYKHNIFRKRFCWIMISLVTLGVVLSGSRGAWLAVLPTISLVLFLNLVNSLSPKRDIFSRLIYQFKKRIIFVRTFFGQQQDLFTLTKKITVALSLFFAMFILSSFYPLLFYKAQSIITGEEIYGGSLRFFERAKSISDTQELSNKSRLRIWQLTINSIKEHPFLGVGIGNFPVVIKEDTSTVKKGASAHNLYLDIFAEIGIFGLVFVLLIAFEILKTSWLVFKRASSSYQKIFGLSFGVYFIWILCYSLVDVVLFNDKVFLFFMVELGILYSIYPLVSKNHKD
ncbi:MAG: O-antigen ligase family protein, partial [Spirochaetota bacterium]|nr:O-antigen ligase family protein [Spirochaetota bacterium]